MTDQNTGVIDTPWDTSSQLSCLTSHGIHTVFRYYNFENSHSLPEKRMQLAEAEALANRDIKIGVIFQQRQDRAGDFSKQRGLSAGRRACCYARDHIGQSPGSGIYFAVDFDASKTDIQNRILPYFEGIKQAMAEESDGDSDYRIGAYGSGLVCRTLREKGAIELVWLSMSRGFRETEEELNAGNYHLAQLPPATKLCGLGVDFNQVNPKRSDFGAFSVDPTRDGGGQNGYIGDRYKVTARSGLRLREGAGTNFEIIGGLPYGHIVHVKSITEGWAKVDQEGDGKVDGFASAAFLEQV